MQIQNGLVHGSHPELQLDALSAEHTSPLEPKPIIVSSPPRLSVPIPPSSSKRVASVPTNSTPGVITDKEREKLLYPGRVNLTSE